MNYAMNFKKFREGHSSPGTTCGISGSFLMKVGIMALVMTCNVLLMCYVLIDSVVYLSCNVLLGSSILETVLCPTPTTLQLLSSQLCHSTKIIPQKWHTARALAIFGLQKLLLVTACM